MGNISDQNDKRPTAAAPQHGHYDTARRLSFVHVPKSAGTALTRALAVAVNEQHYRVGWDLSAFGGFRDFGSIDLDVRSCIWSSPADVPQAPAFVCGHASPSTFLNADPGTQLLTILREPMSRLLSQWVFWRRGPDDRGPWGAFADRIWLARKPLAEFLRDPLAAFGSDNATARLLLHPHRAIPVDGFIDPRHDAELYEDAVHCLERFDFVDIIENLRWTGGLSKWLGIRINVAAENVTDYVDPPFRSALDHEMTRDAVGLMRQRTRIDDRVWDFIAGRRFPKDDRDDLKAAAFAAAVARHAVSMQP